MSTKTKFPISKLHQAEFIQFIVSTMETLDDHPLDYSDDMADSIIARLKANLPGLKASLSPKNTSDTSQAIREALSLRNRDLTAFRFALRGHQSDREKENIEAYENLSLLLSQYKDLSRGNLEETFARLASFLEKLGQEPYSNNINTLSLTQNLTNLTTSNKALYTLYRRRYKEKSIKPNQTIGDIRERVTTDYQLLYNHFQTRLSIKPSDTCLKIIQGWNDIRKEHYLKIKLRKSKNDTEITEHKTTD